VSIHFSSGGLSAIDFRIIDLLVTDDRLD